MSSSSHRRTFLKMLEGGAAAAFLTPFAAQIGRAGPAPTPRFVFFLEGNCYEPGTVLSPGARARLDADFTSRGQPALPSGAAARNWPRRYGHTSVMIDSTGDLDQSMALAGLGTLASKTAVLFGLSSKITGGGHTAYHGALASRRSASGNPTGETIDAHLSLLPSVRSPVFDAVRLGYCSFQHYPGIGLDYGTCALDANVAAPMVLDPAAAFDMLYGSAAAPDRFQRDGRILEFAATDVRRSLDRLIALSPSSPERARLEAYLASITDNIARRGALDGAVAALTSMPSPYTAPRRPEDLYAVLTAQASNLLVALQGGLTNVGVVGIGTGYRFDTFYDASHTGRHTAHHESETSTTRRDYIHEQTRLQMNVMIEFARTLDAIPEGTGTFLDHTVLVYIGDNGETHHATGDEFPVVIMGGGALGLNTGGRTLLYPGLDQMNRGHRQISNLWNTLGYLAGESLDEFGGENTLSGQRSAPGPLAELMT